MYVYVPKDVDLRISQHFIQHIVNAVIKENFNDYIVME